MSSNPVAIVVACALVLGALASTALAEPSGWEDLARSFSGPRDGDIVVSHPPLNTGGLASDTSFYYPYPTLYWQRVADDILLANPAVITDLRWWGFYSEAMPQPNELMRIRFYGSRASNGLPDEANLVYEETFTNPTRTATGRIVLVDEGPLEYLFNARLTTPVSLASGLRYWLEIVQVGDIDSRFRWEVSPTTDGSGFAFINPTTVDWRSTLPGATVNTAYQLVSVPEPTALGVFLCVLLFAGRRRSR
jgi:hypothetical protein